MYTIINENYLKYCLKVLEDTNFEIEEICDVYYNSKIQNKSNLWYIVKLTEKLNFQAKTIDKWIKML